MHAKCDRVRTWATSRAIETDGKDSFDKVSLEVAVLDRPTLVHKGRESELRRIDIKSDAPTRSKVMSEIPNQPGMYGERHVSGRVLYSRHQLKIESHAPFSFYGNSGRKANGEIVGDAGCLSAGV